MTELAIARTGPCAGHPCDTCARCRRGQCCRRDQPGYHLPALGAWDGPIHGELGVLATDDGRAQCHICGRWFLFLGRHVGPAHDLSCDEYRAVFGLRAGHGLLGPALQPVYQQLAARNLREQWKQAGTIAKALTPEQRRAIGSRPWPLEAKRDPQHRRVQQELARRGGAKVQALYAAGQWRPPGGARARAALAQGRSRLSELMADPAWHEAWRQRVAAGRAAGKAPRVEVSCAVCGASFAVTVSMLEHGRGKVCSRACARVVRGQALRANGPGQRPEVRAQMRATARQRMLERAEYRAVAEQVARSDPEALGRLPDRQVRIVQGYYGLEQQERRTQEELAQELGLSRRRIGQLLRAAVATLLGPTGR